MHNQWLYVASTNFATWDSLIFVLWYSRLLLLIRWARDPYWLLGGSSNLVDRNPGDHKSFEWVVTIKCSLHLRPTSSQTILDQLCYVSMPGKCHISYQKCYVKMDVFLISYLIGHLFRINQPSIYSGVEPFFRHTHLHSSMVTSIFLIVQKSVFHTSSAAQGGGGNFRIGSL